MLQDNPKKIIRVGDINSDVLHDEYDGKKEGYVYDYLNKISEITGWEYEYVEATWVESMDMLESGELDILPQVQYTPERAEKFYFPDYNMGMNSAYLLVLANRDDIYYNDYASFNGMRIGTIRGARQIELLEELAEEQNFTYELVEYDFNADIVTAMESGEIDMALNESMHSVQDYKIVACFRPDPIYFAVSKRQPKILKELNAALEQIQTIDVNYHGHLYERHYDCYDHGSLAYTKEESEYIATHPVLKVNYNRTWAPICFESEETGQCSGVVPDILKMIEKETGFTFQYVPTVNSEKIEDMLTNGELDLILLLPPILSPEQTV